MQRRRGRLLAGLTVMASLAAPATAVAQPLAALPLSAEVLVPATAIVADLRNGQAVDLAQVHIAGDLDLRSLGTVTAPFRCIGCTIDGALLATDVVFQRIVDLTASRIAGHLDLRGAVFNDAFVLRTTDEGVGAVVGTVDARLARFSGPATFDGATFGRDTDFSGARFGGDVSFADSGFRGSALFDSVDFGEDAVFTSTPATSAGDGPCRLVEGAFHEQVSFVRAEFNGIADFQQRCFEQGATIRDVVFSGTTDFLSTTFHGPIDFSGSAFRAKTSFQAATFFGDATFDLASADSSIAFFGATLRGDTSFFGVTGAGSLSLERLRMANGKHLILTNLYAPDLRLDLQLVPSVNGEEVQKQVLAMIERSARARGDIELANRAHHDLLEANARHAVGLHWLFDQAYRLVGGYLVRPSRPLIAFVTLLFLVVLVRTFIVRPYQPFPALLDSVGAAFRKTPRVPETSPDETANTPEARDAGLRRRLVVSALWIESLSFKLLIALFLLGLANSNATTRQVVDAIWR